MKNIKPLRQSFQRKVVCYLAFFLFIFACKQEFPTQNNPSVPQEPDAPILIPQDPIEGVDGFITIPILQKGITGSGLKGAFIEGRVVRLSPFKASKHEVTYKLWREVLDWARDNGYVFERLGRRGNITGAQTSETEPVTFISWRDCIVWCNAYTEMQNGNTDECVYRKSENDDTVLKNAKAFTSVGSQKNYECDDAFFDKSKKGFRLPTEAEWEWTARGGKNIMFSGTDDENELSMYACFSDNSNTRTFEVGTLKSNGYGLYDMSGNVWEWCFDRAGDVEVGEVLDPIGATSGVPRIARGGSWFNKITHMEITFRQKGAPSYTANHTGFRLFKTL